MKLEIFHRWMFAAPKSKILASEDDLACADGWSTRGGGGGGCGGARWILLLHYITCIN